MGYFCKTIHHRDLTSSENCEGCISVTLYEHAMRWNCRDSLRRNAAMPLEIAMICISFVARRCRHTAKLLTLVQIPFVWRRIVFRPLLKNALFLQINLMGCWITNCIVTKWMILPWRQGLIVDELPLHNDFWWLLNIRRCGLTVKLLTLAVVAVVLGIWRSVWCGDTKRD